MITLCDTQAASIHEALRDNDATEANTPAEKIAKFAVEEKLRWALSLLDSFKAWGY